MVDLKPMTPEVAKRLRQLRYRKKTLERELKGLQKMYEDGMINSFEKSEGLRFTREELSEVNRELKELKER